MANQLQWLLASLMLTTASMVQAQQPDSSRAALIAEAINAHAAVELADSGADKSQVEIYVGSQADAPFLRDITLRVNDNNPTRYEFSDTESHAMQRGALYRVTLTGVKDGTNQLIVDFHTVSPAEKGIGVFKHGQIIKRFSSGTSVFELALNKGNFVSDATFEVAISEQATGSSADQIGAADLMIADGEYFLAASILTQLSTSNSNTQSSEEISKRLGICRTELGLQSSTNTSAQVTNDLEIRFNQALLLVQQEKGSEATSTLDTIGRTETTESSTLTLRDQANLVLAYYFLDHGQGTEAIPVFERIRSPGPYANAGLLGLGWALLEPPHRDGAIGATAIPATSRYPTIVTPRLTTDILALKQEQAPRVPSASKDQQIALRKALVPWTELTGRDPTDPAVLEGMLATAWTLYHFGAYDQAQDSYKRAADQLEKMRGWYDRGLENIRNGGMVSIIASKDGATESGWPHANATLPPAKTHWWLGDTPETPKTVVDNFYFERLLLNDDFADALQSYRNLISIARALQNVQVKLGVKDSSSALQSQLSTLAPALSSAIAAQRTQLETIASADLVFQKKQLEKYLIEARFALATIYDRPELASAK